MPGEGRGTRRGRGGPRAHDLVASRALSVPRVSGPLFITGGSGFVGQRVLRLLANAGFADVRVLARDPARLAAVGVLPLGWRVVRGDLARPADWRSHLEGVGTVVHLAASTGKVRQRDHVETIVAGTRRLLDAAHGADVARFLYVSSVAAGFAKIRYYHYAHAKIAAEELVRASPFDWLIVRPTMVLGPASPVLAGLRKLAALPVPLMFGAGVDVVEPIAGEDLAAFLVSALGAVPWAGRTVTVGGPERVTVGELLGRIRGGAPVARFMHLPIAPVREILGILEPLLFPILPLTAGQLATFDNPSAAESDEFTRQLATPRVPIAGMIADAPHGH